LLFMLFSGTIGHWYWQGSPKDGNVTTYGRWPMIRSFYVVMRFHLGSVAFGSLMVSIIQFVRYFSAYVQHRAQALTKRTRVARAIACVVQYCLKCLESCIAFVSRNAYIHQALYGDSFCVSTKLAFETLTSNIASVALVTFLGDLILRFGQIFITLMASLTCYLWLQTHDEYKLGGALELHSFWWPTFLTGWISWFIANEALAIFDITVETLLQCFCQDVKLKKALKSHKEAATPEFKEFIEGNGSIKDTNRRRSSVQQVMEVGS